MKLSVLIVTWVYEEWPMLKNNLDALIRHKPDFDWEILLVYNNSGGEELLSKVRERYGDLYGEGKLIRSYVVGVNRGFNKGCNAGAKHVVGEYLAILNPDIVVEDQKDMEMMVHHLEQNPDVGLVGPQLHNPDTERTIQFTCTRRYERFTPIYRRTPLGRFGFARRSIDRHLMADFDHQSNRDVDWLMGSCMVLRTSLFRELKGLDERLFIYFADYELADRIHDKGLKVRYLAPSSIVHDHQRSSNYGSGFKALFKTISSKTGRAHIQDWFIYMKNRALNSYWHNS